MVIQRFEILFVAAIVLLGIAGRLWVSQPTWIHWDENYYLNIGQNYVDRGELTPTMWRMDASNVIAGSGSGYGLLVLVEWLDLVDGSLVAGRLLMVACGIASAGIMYHVARLWWDSRVAGAAALVFAMAGTSPFYTLVLRMDAIGILAYCLVLWAYVYAARREVGRWVHAGIGVAAVAAVEFHTLGILYLLALTLVYFVRYVREMLAARRLVFNTPPVFFAAAAFLAGMVYIALHILPDPESYFHISRECFECNEGLITTESKRLLRFLLLRPHELLILIVIIAAAAVRRRPEDAQFLWLIGGWLVAQAVAGSPPYTHYTNHIWPLMALGVGGFVARGFDGHLRRWRIMVGLNGALVMLVTVLALHATGFHPYLLAHPVEDSAEVDYIRAHIPRDTVVMGVVGSFYQLRDYRHFLSYRDGDGYGIDLRGETILDFWGREAPDVILLRPEEFEDDDELAAYMAARSFQQVLPDLWLSERFAPARQETP